MSDHFAALCLAAERAYDKYPGRFDSLGFLGDDDPQGLRITYSESIPAVICQQPDDPDSLDAAFDVLLVMVMVEARKRLGRKNP